MYIYEILQHPNRIYPSLNCTFGRRARSQNAKAAYLPCSVGLSRIGL